MKIAFINHKGGIGKTTLAVNTAFRSKEMKKSLLLFDFDRQANSMQLYSGYAWNGEPQWQGDNYITLVNGNTNTQCNWSGYENILFDCPPSYDSADNFFRFLQQQNLTVDIWIIPCESRTSVSGAETIIKKIKEHSSGRIVIVMNRCAVEAVSQADRAAVAMFPNIELCLIPIPMSSKPFAKFEQVGGKPIWEILKGTRTASRMKQFSEAVLFGLPHATVIKNANTVTIDATREKFIIHNPNKEKLVYGKWK